VTEPSRAVGKFGRKPNDPSKPRLRLAGHLTAVPPSPAVVDWLSKVQSWPMYGNDRYGDCVWAMIGHAVEAYTTYGQGSTVTVTEADVLKGYADVTGFNPDDPSTDQGTVIQDALNYWRKTGVGGHKILAFAQVDHTNMDELKAALNVFGALLIGVNFPRSAMDQFNSGQPWDVVGNDGGIEGGHAVHVGLDQTDGVTFKLVTWGALEGMTAAWWSAYVEEAWIAVAPEWLDASGHSPEGIDLYGLGEDLHEMTGQPNPFPAPSPTPTPRPVPTPTPSPGPSPEPVPAPSGADVKFARVLRHFVQHPYLYSPHHLAREAQTWMTAEGL